MKSFACCRLVVGLFLVFSCLSVQGQGIVEQHGLLRVQGNRILDRNNDTVCLAGISFFWSNIGWGGIRFYNTGVVNYLADEWKVPVIRVSMGVEANGGYIQNPSSQKTLITEMIDAAIDAGIYILVDWHSHTAENYQEEAQAFFGELARLYGDHDNIIYEIYNEPLQVSWSTVIKPYCEAVIDSIRAYDADNMIIAGTPNWSQFVDEAAGDPIADTNIAYSLHFYAATHKQWLRDRATTALNKNVALFITEWGSCESSGNGIIDQASVDAWMDFCRVNKISHLNWALNDKLETASILKSGAPVTGGWTEDNLTASGKLVRKIGEYWPEKPPVTSAICKGHVDNDIYVYMDGDMLKFRNTGNYTLERISVFDITGLLLFDTINLNMQNVSFNLSSLPSGRFLIVRGITGHGVFSQVLIR
ncbi:MAG: glycoside hydrolase family 5 protein [Bacteroidales bacterium]|nr:glycoside hydrolase family 5 protein [Bacteroidales bacterium]MBN2762235.1 glycoside hydrolase family 5 protein [Bacteroidales bacterium]